MRFVQENRSSMQSFSCHSLYVVVAFAVKKFLYLCVAMYLIDKKLGYNLFPTLKLPRRKS